MTHIRLVHADDPHFIIQCSFQGCTRTFRKFTVYRNHVYACHDTTVLDTPGLSVPEDMDDSDRKLVIKLLLLPTLHTLLYLPPVEVVSFMVTGNAYI